MGDRFLEALTLLEEARVKMEMLRTEDREGCLIADSRALSVALTHLETAELWLANARKEF